MASFALESFWTFLTAFVIGIAFVNSDVTSAASNVNTSVTRSTPRTTFFESTQSTTLPTTTSQYGYCAAYCNLYGYFVERRYCKNTDEFCCGTVTYRWCCNEESKRLPNYKDMTACPQSVWWFYNWRIIVGLLGTLMVIMMFAACIYYCCMGLCRSNQTVQRVQRRLRPNSGDDHNLNTISGSGSRDNAVGRRNSFTFDPSNPNAFEPPPYDSLSKDPPKYSDIFTENGQVNPAFIGDALAETSAASASMAAAEEAIAQSSTEGATCASAGGATGGATGTTSSCSQNASSPSSSSTDNPSPSTRSSGQTARTQESTPAARNRTTETTPIPNISQAVPWSMSAVNVDSPPPYTREDTTSRGRNPPSGRSPNHANRTVELATDIPSGGETVHRIEVETRVPPTSNEQRNIPTN